MSRVVTLTNDRYPRDVRKGVAAPEWYQPSEVESDPTLTESPGGFPTAPDGASPDASSTRLEVGRPTRKRHSNPHLRHEDEVRDHRG